MMTLSDLTTEGIECMLRSVPVPVTIENPERITGFLYRHQELLPALSLLTNEILTKIPGVSSLDFELDEEHTGSPEEPMFWIDVLIEPYSREAREAADTIRTSLIAERFSSAGISNLKFTLSG